MQMLVHDNIFPFIYILTGIDHGGSIAVSSGPGWNDPPAAALAMAKSKAAAKTATVSAITGPITQPLAMMQPAESQHQYQPPPMNFGAQQQGYQYQDQQPQQSYDQFGGQAAAVAPAPPPPMNMMQPQSNNPYSHTVSQKISKLYLYYPLRYLFFSLYFSNFRAP